MSDTTVGITGARGFIGKHLAARAAREEGWNVVLIGRDAFATDAVLQERVAQCDVIVHLAGANRGLDEDVYETNVSLAEKLSEAIRSTGVCRRVIYASSTQEELENAYGRSKREAGRILSRWASEFEGELATLVIPNVYGAGCRPRYNSVVATFCHQLVHGETPQIHEDKELELICVSELVEEIVKRIESPAAKSERYRVNGTSRMSVSRLLETLTSFRDHYFERNVIPEISSVTSRNLYATFLSHVELNDLCHRPPLHTDDRGSLVEVIKLAQAGQVFFSTTKPGVVRGDHFHTRKVEWFCVLRGEAVIRLRRVGDQEVHEFRVDSANPQFISIPVMHTHNIENVGDEDLLTMFWCNEIFDADDPDTYFEKVA